MKQFENLHLMLMYVSLKQTSKYLLFVDDVDAGFDVGKGVRGGQDGLAFVLLVQVAMCPTVQRERRAVHEGAQVIVFVEVRDALLQLICVKEGLHVCDLKVCLEFVEKLKSISEIHSS